MKAHFLFNNTILGNLNDGNKQLVTFHTCKKWQSEFYQIKGQDLIRNSYETSVL